MDGQAHRLSARLQGNAHGIGLAEPPVCPQTGVKRSLWRQRWQGKLQGVIFPGDKAAKIQIPLAVPPAVQRYAMKPLTLQVFR